MLDKIQTGKSSAVNAKKRHTINPQDSIVTDEKEFAVTVEGTLKLKIKRRQSGNDDSDNGDFSLVLQEDSDTEDAEAENIQVWFRYFLQKQNAKPSFFQKPCGMGETHLYWKIQ